MKYIIQVEDLTFTYPSASTPALNNVSFRVRPGEFVGITGPTGAGKSTLCQCLNGLIPHHTGGELSGVVAVCGMDAPTFSPAQLARVVGSVFQDPDGQLICETVEEEIVFGMENMGFTREEMETRLQQVLEMVGLGDCRYRRTKTLSGGQKQRLAIAAALAMEPKILVLDEPTSELDPQGTRSVYAALRFLNRERGITVLIVDHKVEVMAEYVNSLIVMQDGEIVLAGDTRDVLNRDLVRFGVDSPAVSRLALALKARGIGADPFPITTEEGKSLMEVLRTRVSG